MKQFFDLSVSKVARKTTCKVYDFPIARKSIQLSIWLWRVTVGNRIPARQTKIERNVLKWLSVRLWQERKKHATNMER